MKNLLPVKYGFIIASVIFINSCFLITFPDVELTVNNDSNDSIVGFYYRVTGEEIWNENSIIENIDINSSIKLLLPKAKYDFKANFFNNGSSFLDEVDLENYDIYEISIN